MALGSFYQPDRWDKEVPPTYSLVQGILREASLLYTPFASLKEEDLRITVGLRPGRRGDVRLERDQYESSLIHNYGHGRYGMTLSFGCAKEAADLVDQSVGLSPRAKL